MTIFKGKIEQIVDENQNVNKRIFDVLRGFGKDLEISKFVNDINNGITPEPINYEDSSVCAIKTEDKDVWVIETDVYGDYNVFVYNTR